MRSHAEEIGVGFLAPDEYVVAFELAAVLFTVALVAAVFVGHRLGPRLQYMLLEHRVLL